MRCPTLIELPAPPLGKTGWPWTIETPPLDNIIPDKHFWPKISVITPSYQQAIFLEETIRSVLLQGYSNIEYIIIDGGSNDKTIEIIKKYEKYITYWVSETDRGQSHAINKGMQRATGEIVNWLNSDDYLQPGALHHIANIFQEHPNINCYAGVSRVFGCNKEFYSNGTDIYPNNLTKTIAWARIDQPETYFRRSVWQQIGYLNENLHYLMDRDFWIRYLFYYGLEKTYKDNKLLVNFRLHHQSKTVSQHQGFIDESWRLWLTYSEQLNWQNFANSLLTYNSNITPISVSDILNNRQSIQESQLQTYFFLYLKFHSYAQDQRKQAKTYSNYINIEELDRVNLDENKKIDWRMRYTPTFLKKLKEIIFS